MVTQWPATTSLGEALQTWLEYISEIKEKSAPVPVTRTLHSVATRVVRSEGRLASFLPHLPLGTVQESLRLMQDEE